MAEETTPVEATKQDLTDWKAEARKWEERAKSNRAALEKLQETATAGQEAQSELEKALERLTRLEQENATKERALLTAQVAQEKGVPADLLIGDTREELAAYADKILEFRGEHASGPVIPRAGYQPAPPKPSDEKEFVTNLFNRSE